MQIHRSPRLLFVCETSDMAVTTTRQKDGPSFVSSFCWPVHDDSAMEAVYPWPGYTPLEPVTLL